MGEGDQTGCCHLSESYVDVSGVPYHSNCTAPFHHRAFTGLNSSLLTCRVHGFLRLSPYPYASISSMLLETRLVRQGNVFLVISSLMSVLTGLGETQSFVSYSQQGYTSGPSAPKAHTDNFSLNDLHEGPVAEWYVLRFHTTGPGFYPGAGTATAGSDVVQSGRPIFDDFFQHLWPYIGNNTANVVFQMVKRLWLIRIDQ
ncbi:uncharacterized protein TNCV_5030721 [Trichonephila clavipes]|nr:uncharacterized protein TNCV_5030721 [Trichonephila clavipes]